MAIKISPGAEQHAAKIKQTIKMTGCELQLKTAHKTGLIKQC